MKHVNAFTKETEKIVSNRKFQVDFDNASKDEGSKEAMVKTFHLG
jgi:hypothetical protein